MAGNGSEPEEHVRRDSDHLTQTVARVVDEVNACTHALGQLTAELSAVRREVAELRGVGLRTMEAVNRAAERLGSVRERVESVPDSEEVRQTAEDTARHQVEALRTELLRQERDSMRATAKAGSERTWLLVISVVAPILAALLTHLAHVFSK
jgi:hypothetical protein